MTRSVPHKLARVVAAIILLASCASDPAVTPASPSRLDSLPRPLTEAERFVGPAANGFSFALLRQVNSSQRDSNIFISPLGASMALGMTLNGAAGATAAEMRQALGFGDASQASINEGYRGLIDLLRGLDSGTDLRVANAVFHRHDFPFEAEFFRTGKTWFDAEVQALDFTAPASVKTVNDWVSRGTNGKIPTIVQRIDPNEDVMLLVNAVYFRGSWRSRFDPRATTDASFTAADGATQPMKLMHQKERFGYAETSELQAVDLPYGNSAFTMTVILPRPGGDADAIVATLTAESWSGLIRGFRHREVDLYLPKLTLAYERTMNDDLEALGMRLAFERGKADFTGMSPAGRDLFISLVKQKTFVDIHEEGTEAAAATVVVVGAVSAQVPAVMRVDRPFLFVIRERFSGTILFVGKIVRMPPSKG